MYERKIGTREDWQVVRDELAKAAPFVAPFNVLLERTPTLNPPSPYLAEGRVPGLTSIGSVRGSIRTRAPSSRRTRRAA